MTQLVGILNLTPDSFSDGGSYLQDNRAYEHAHLLHKHGAAIIDIGAESTRPGAEALTHEQEWERLEPLLKQLKRTGFNTPLSLDTRHSATALKALDYGISWLNDVSGFDDPAMVDVVQGQMCQLVVMHSLGIPADPKRTLPKDCDAVDEVLTWAEKKVDMLMSRGIDPERIILDPGIGFGKTPEQSAVLLRNIQRLKALGHAVLVGHSRKSFLGTVAHTTPEERDIETCVITAYLSEQEVDYVRVHNVDANRRALAAYRLMKGD